MKKYIVFILISCILSMSFCTPKVYADDIGYARITYSAPIYKHSDMINSVENIYCYLESTYFVKILLKYSTDCYKVSYFDIIGYVKADAIAPTPSTPKQPYPSGINIGISKKCYLRESPTSKGTILSTLSTSDSVNYIGEISSVEIMDMTTDIWYYVKYNNIYGYVYNGYTLGVGNIIPNTEEITYLSATKAKENITPITDTTTIILIIIIFLPVLLILYLLYKPSKHKRV